MVGQADRNQLVVIKQRESPSDPERLSETKVWI